MCPGREASLGTMGRRRIAIRGWFRPRLNGRVHRSACPVRLHSVAEEVGSHPYRVRGSVRACCARWTVQRRSRENHARRGAASLVRGRREPCSVGDVATPAPGWMALSPPRKDGRTGHRPRCAAPSWRRPTVGRAWPRGSPVVAGAQSCPCPPARSTPYPVTVVPRIAHAHPVPAPALLASADARIEPIG
jgi:hypothetical protein